MLSSSIPSPMWRCHCHIYIYYYTYRFYPYLIWICHATPSHLQQTLGVLYYLSHIVCQKLKKRTFISYTFMLFKLPNRKGGLFYHNYYIFHILYISNLFNFLLLITIPPESEILNAITKSMYVLNLMLWIGHNEIIQS